MGAPFLVGARLSGNDPTDEYPFNLPAVRAIGQLPFDQVTVLVGDNGTGKSTIVEAIAVAAGFNAEGGSRNLRFDTYATHSGLHQELQLVWRRKAPWGWFLRAETFYEMATHIATDPGPRPLQAYFPEFHGESHGESFLDLAIEKFRGEGLYLLDEPESALSLTGQLKLLRIIHDSCGNGSQFFIATHSPLLMAYPGATIVELDDGGVAVRSYDDLAVVGLWRRFLDDPPSVLRTLLDDTD